MSLRRDEMVAAQYFAAVAGTAAMRHCVTEPSAVRARLDDVRRVIEHIDEFPNNLAIPVIEHPLSDGYDLWAERYDTPNPAVEADEAAVHAILTGVRAGTALDAACGTGRHSRYLVDQGFDVVGVDANRSMLDVAEAKVPEGEFHLGDLEDLPLGDASVDVAVCSLALCHLERVAPAVSEMARVVRPGGTVILSDVHPAWVGLTGGAAVFPTGGEALELHFVRDLPHPISEWVTAITDAGLVIRACREPAVPESAITSNPAYPMVPDAVRGAFGHVPMLVVWHVERPPT